MGIFELTLITFAITLIVTKSKIMGGKREFVEQRYEASKVGNHKPGMIHTWWHAMWTCPMCLGFWVALPLSILSTTCPWWAALFIVFGLNWLVHCLENFMFQVGYFLENSTDKEKILNKDGNSGDDRV